MYERNLIGGLMFSTAVGFWTLGVWKFVEIIVWGVNHITIK